ncbi:MAG: hypothetical protein ACE5LB_01095 [Acidiferrobacterales bacterium]
MNRRPNPIAALAFVFGGLLPGMALGDAKTASTGGVEQGAVVEGVQPLAAEDTHAAVVEGRKDLLAIQWQHHVSDIHSLTFAAGYGDDVYLDETRYDPVSAMASVSWTRQWAGRTRPAFSGSVFIGDEGTSEDLYRSLDRRYYGISFGGRMTLSGKHSPFVSYRMLRSDLGGESPDLLATPSDYSRLTAGWDWQVRKNWRLRAEAEFTQYDSALTLYPADRRRLFFSTRFDFR